MSGSRKAAATPTGEAETTIQCLQTAQRTIQRQYDEIIELKKEVNAHNTGKTQQNQTTSGALKSFRSALNAFSSTTSKIKSDIAKLSADMAEVDRELQALEKMYSKQPPAQGGLYNQQQYSFNEPNIYSRQGGVGVTPAFPYFSGGGYISNPFNLPMGPQMSSPMPSKKPATKKKTRKAGKEKKPATKKKTIKFG
jgi:hypothetical protein